MILLPEPDDRNWQILVVPKDEMGAEAVSRFLPRNRTITLLGPSMLKIKGTMVEQLQNSPSGASRDVEYLDPHTFRFGSHLVYISTFYQASWAAINAKRPFWLGSVDDTSPETIVGLLKSRSEFSHVILSGQIDPLLHQYLVSEGPMKVRWTSV